MASLSALRRRGLPIVAAVALVSVADSYSAEIPRPSTPAVVWEEQGFVLQKPGTELFLNRFRVIKEMGIEHGMALAQIGVSDGVYTTLLARAVGASGIVFAVDPDDAALARVQERAFAYHVDNIVSVPLDDQSISLPADSVQLLLLVDSYNRLEHPEVVLKSSIAALAPYGDLVLVDKQRIPGVTRADIFGELRIDKLQAIEEVTAAGLSLVEERDLMKWSYFLRFRKIPESDDSEDDPAPSDPADAQVTVGDIDAETGDD